MTINYTTLLGLAQPVTGTEQGTWGDTVNDQITALIEEAVAGGESINVTAGNVTLTDTAGQANQARNAILVITGTPGTTRNVVAPSQSKAYIIVNNSDAAVVIKGSATTGVTIAAGARSLVAWNGSDFVEIGQAGDVDGPSSSTDNAIARFDGTTGKLIQNSVVTIADSTGDISGVGQLNATTADLTNLEVTNIKAKDGTAAATIADSTGKITVSTELAVDNLSLSGNTISSTDTNGNVVIAPNGTGDVQLDADTVRVGDSNVNATVTTNGTGDLILNTNSGTNSGSITIQDGVNGNIVIAPNGNGQVQITNAALDLTSIEVTNIKAKDGTAAATIADSTGKITVSTELAVDNLNLSGNTLSSTDSNGNIVLAPNGTGDVQLDADTVRIGDSNANATLTTNGTGDLILNTNSGTNSGSITIQDGVNGNIIIAPNGNGQVQITNVALDLTTLEVTNIKAKDGTAAMTIADTTGNVTVSSELNVDNLNLSGNTISSTNSNGNIVLAPNGTGDVQVDADTLRVGDAAVDATIQSNGNADLILKTGNATTGTLTLADGANGNLTLALNGTGQVVVNAGAVGTPTIAPTGDLNTGIFFPAADTIAFAEGGAEAMRIDSSGNVGIGTSSPTSKLYVTRSSTTDGGTETAFYSECLGGPYTSTTYGIRGYATNIYSGSYGVFAEANQPDTGGLGVAYGGYFKASSGGTGTLGQTFGLRVANAATSGGNAYGIYSSTVAGASNVYPFILNHATANIFTVSSAGNVVAAGTIKGASTISVGGATPSASGAGITFPATQSASSDANTLDDYEEGTWTPVLSDGTNNATSAAGVIGYYTKIGRFVYVNGYLAVTSLGSVSGSVRITGLPFAAANISNNFSSVTTGYASAFSLNAGESVTAYVGPNLTYMNMYKWSAATGVATLQGANWTASGDLRFSMFYIAAT